MFYFYLLLISLVVLYFLVRAYRSQRRQLDQLNSIYLWKNGSVHGQPYRLVSVDGGRSWAHVQWEQDGTMRITGPADQDFVDEVVLQGR